ncbi:carboxypeptidase-like regulatory domain-containing protein [Sorangium sp. So ce1000]|uniref:carboxypeptidase-like regulatory domain-containing protein n=1 Tax=Sorangium sp. So ce1000 TaxID=3133325 RepID=UPI003F6047BD
MMRWAGCTALAAIAALGMTAARAAQAQPAAAAQPAAVSAAPAQPAAGKAAPAQPGAAKPGAKPATPSEGAAPAGTGAPAATSTAADAGAADAASALPPGHPEVGEGLPSGHPPVGKPPAGNAASRRASEQLTGMFDAPEDTVQEDTGLPPGVLVLTVLDPDGTPVPRISVDIDVLQSSVAKGDSRQRMSRETDDAGTLRLENLTIGSGTSYGISVTRDGGTFSLPHFGLNAEAGKRAALHVYDATPELNRLLVGTQGIVYLQLRQDSIAVEQLFQVYNLGRIAWLPDETFALPRDYKAFNKSEGMDEEMRFDEVKGTGVALRGTVSPGRHEGQFRWQVPLQEQERQTIRIELPPRMAQVRVMAEASKSMTLNVAGFPAAQRTQNRDGKKILITEMQGTRTDGGMKFIEITLGGLPTPGAGRWIALVLAGATVIAGAALNLVRRREDRGPDDEERRELIEARNALLDEFVELERARKRGDVGPKTYDRVRAALLDALARIVAMIEARQARKSTAGAREAAGALKADAAGSPRP